MTRDHEPSWQRIKEVFHETLRRPRGERSAFLREACGDDDALRAEVAELLAAHEEVGSELPGAPDVELGTRLGPYELVEKIGEGGFGVVYLAEQHEPLRRRVALKVIKLGMDTQHVLARFHAERQALALMDHPNIATVLDAGATESGRPYFVMELVRGEPITEFCDRNGLGTLERLALFAQVCHAVEHAHSKGIVHRDVKPSNVLVAMHDGKPVPKVIDFGIAKATERRLTEESYFTEFRQFIGTPEYMSPEQAEMSGAPVDPRTDVYSLGVLLYELLTGTTPFEPRTLRAAGYAEIGRILREEEPPKPSTRISTLGDNLPTVAGQRDATPRDLGRRVRGDLDWIAMKALEKDRARRYETAGDFARDIARHLGDEPVSAGPPGLRYRARKLARRHRGALLSASLVGLVIALGLVAATAAFAQAARSREMAQVAHALARENALRAQAAEEAARDEAEAQRVRAEETLSFLREVLVDVDPVAGGTSQVTVAEVLDRAAERVDAGELGDDPTVETSMREALGRAYARVGRHDGAAPHLARAHQLWVERAGADDPRSLRARVAWLASVHASDPTHPIDVEELEAILERQLGGLEADAGDVTATGDLVLRLLERAGETARAARWRERLKRP